MSRRVYRARRPDLCAVVRGALGLSLALAMSPCASAADWDFQPVATVDVSNVDNVQVASSGREEESDLLFRAAANLVARRSSSKDDVAFSYRIARDVYEEFGELDNTDHLASVDWTRRSSNRATWSVTGFATLLENPRIENERPDPDFVATPRARLLRYSVDAGWTYKLDRRSALLAGASYVQADFDEQVIQGEDLDEDGTLDTPPLLVDDSSTFSARFGWLRELSRQSDLRVYYRGSIIDEGIRGELDVNRFIFGWGRGAEETVRVDISAGVGFRSRDDDLGGAVDTGTETDFVGSIDVVTDVFRTGTLSAGASQDISGTSGTAGPSNTLAVRLAYSQPFGARHRLQLTSSYAARDPVDDILGAVDGETFAYRAEWQYTVNPRWIVFVGGSTVDQESDDPNDARNADFSRFSAGVRWSPLAKRGKELL